MDMAGAMTRAARNQEWKDEIIRLLTEVVLFQPALDQKKSSFVENNRGRT